MKKNIIRRKEISTVSLAEVHPLLQRVYRNRGIQTNAELERDLKNLHPFHDLLGMDKALVILKDALLHQKNILIVGDFDADGATSTAVAIRALRSFGAKNISFLVPNRFAFGYGLTPELVDVAKKNKPDVIITVDNGIANFAGVQACVDSGIKIIVTDHHLPADVLPNADAIINPNQPHDPFPSKNLAGVGVIFYVMLALRRFLAQENWFLEQNISEPTLASLLDIVALGTVADVVPLDQNNRIMVYQGINRIRRGFCIPGITALLEIAGRNQSSITASDLGFAVAPRLNAAGRLDDMSLGIECLLTDDIDAARKIAFRLSSLNEERRAIEKEMQTQAVDVLSKIHLDNKKLIPAGIALFDETWHQGVIGILASRLKDRFNRPVVAFAKGNNGEIKGSARSIHGIHIRDVLALIAANSPDLISKFGGHAMAAGLTLPISAFQTFADKFNEIIGSLLQEEHMQHNVLSDGELAENDLTVSCADVLREAGPWGQAFPEPIFDGKFEIIEQRLVGNKHLKMILTQGEKLFDAIVFNIDLQEWPNYRCNYVHIAYRLDINEYKGRRQVQLMVEHIEPLENR